MLCYRVRTQTHMIMDWLCGFVMGEIWVFLFREEMDMELGFGIVSLGFISYWAT